MSSDVIILIPARLASTRLPNKPLADIAGVTMIIRVVEAAIAANIGEVVVAAGDQEIFDVVNGIGYKALMTPADLPSGSDRIFNAYQQLKDEYRWIINLQGDLPNIDPDTIKQLYARMVESEDDIVTMVAPMLESDEMVQDPNVVKAVIAENQRALYFTRSACPYGHGEYYQHVGVYGYKASALMKFISLPPSPLEMREKLEQLRALENGLTISTITIDQAPISVDTMEDLIRARQSFTRN